MDLKRQPLRVVLSAWTILSLLAGCTTSAPQTTPATTKAQVTAPAVPTVTDMPTSTPTQEPSPMAVTPTPLATIAPTPVPLENPGFEEPRIMGWTQKGDLDAVRLDDNGHSSDTRLTHQGTTAYQVETSQTITNLANGWHTLRVWARSSGGQKAVYVALACGDEEKRVEVPPTTPGYRWIQLAVSNQVTDGECTIRLVSEGEPETWASFDDVGLVAGQARLSMLGADISSLHKSEDLGGVYKDANGIPGDALKIMQDQGLNYARLRVWVDPADGYHDKAEILAMARRLKALGIRLLVDFHYSDNWADPGKQIKPAAWKDLDFEQLKQALYDHTYDVCSSLVAQGTPPDMVQVGNEINSGMLWPDGSYEKFDNLAALLKEGYRAVKDCSNTTLVMLHIAEGGDNDLARWWFDNIIRREVTFDVIGISYYPYWHGSLPQLQYNLNDISERYDKDVIVVETAYAFSEQDDDNFPNIAEPGLMVPNYPYTPEGQRAMLRDVMAVVRAVNNGRGLGVFYWDATWMAVPGNGWDNTNPAEGNAWENQALFDFDGQVLPAFAEYLKP